MFRRRHWLTRAGVLDVLKRRRGNTVTDEVFPDWMDEAPVGVVPGSYLWTVAVEKAEFKDLEREKPYAELTLVVIEGPESGFHFTWRLYIHKAAKGWAHYFLKKFDYNQDALSGPRPMLRRTLLEGLRGKMSVEAREDDRWGFQIEPKGFDHENGTELEGKQQKGEAVIDVFDDVSTNDELSSLD
jgi:hypothetical protein